MLIKIELKLHQSIIDLKTQNGTFPRSFFTFTFTFFFHILHDTKEESEIRIEFNEHICKLNVAENLSSHDVIVGKIRVSLAEKVHDKSEMIYTYKDFEVKKPKWNSDGIPHYQKQCSDTLFYLMNEFGEPETIPILSELVSKMFVLSAETCFETSIHKKRNHPQHNMPYFTPEHRQAT